MLIQMNRGTLSNYPTKKPGRKPGFCIQYTDAKIVFGAHLHVPSCVRKNPGCSSGIPGTYMVQPQRISGNRDGNGLHMNLLACFI